MKLLALVLFPFLLAAQDYTCEISTPTEITMDYQWEGFGVEWDPFLLNKPNRDQGVTEDDWNLIVGRIKELNPSLVRVMVQLEWASKDAELTVWDWDNEQMRLLYRYLDVLKEIGADVVLTEWGWTAGRYGDPADPLYAQGIAQLVKGLIDRGYPIKYLVIGNEPDNEMAAKFGMDSYVSMYQQVAEQLDSTGIGNEVTLTGPDMGGQWDFMMNSMDRLHEVLEAYDFHRYSSRNETGNFDLPGDWETLFSHTDLWRGQAIERDPDGASKPILITEAGRDGGVTNSHPLIGEYEYAIHMADYATTVLKTRLNGMIAWNLGDQLYFDWGQDMKWGMWAYKDEGWALRPWGQPWALVTKFAPRGSTKLNANGTPLSSPGIEQTRCAAVTRPGGGTSIFLINRTDAAESVRILSDEDLHPLDVYAVTPTTLEEHPDLLSLPASGSETGGTDFSVQVPSNSFVLLAETDEAPPPPPPPPPPPVDEPPSAMVLSPANGAVIERKALLPISAEVTEGSNPIAYVETYASDRLVCTTLEAPYTCVWRLPGAPGKTYSIRVSAYDTKGLRGESATILIRSEERK